MRTLNNIFNTPEKYLEEVIILPLGANPAPGDYTLPNGLKWDEFEYIEWFTYNPSSKTNDMFGSETINKTILNGGYPWLSYSNFKNVPDNYSVEYYLRANSPTTYTIYKAPNVGAGAQVGSIVGYRRRYSTQNISKIVELTPDNTTGGTFNASGHVQTGHRYSLDIASVLGSDYVGKDLIIQPELYIAGDSYTGWGAISTEVVHTSDWVSYGVSATQRDDGKIDVLTGRGALILSKTGAPNVWNGGGITTAKCRIKVWKVDALVMGGGLVTPAVKREVLYDGAAVTVDQKVNLNKPITSFDEIRIYASIDNGNVTSTITVDSDEVIKGNAQTCRIAFISGTDNYRASVAIDSAQSTNSSLHVLANAATWPSGGIYKVIGIKY